MKMVILPILIVCVNFAALPQSDMNQDTKKMNNIFLYHLKLTEKYKDSENWMEETMRIIEQHGSFLDSLGQNGTLLFAGRTNLNPEDDNLLGLALIKASSWDAAKQIMANDPAVIAGIQQATIIPFNLALAYFENLKTDTK